MPLCLNFFLFLSWPLPTAQQKNFKIFKMAKKVPILKKESFFNIQNLLGVLISNYLFINKKAKQRKTNTFFAFGFTKGKASNNIKYTI